MGSNPKYYAIAMDILNDIGSKYLIGKLLPSETELETLYQCSRSTIRSAVNHLALIGYLEKGRGIGTLVKIPQMIYDDSKPLSFTEEMTVRGKNHNTIIKDFSVIRDPRIAIELGVVPATEILQIARLRHIENSPGLFETSYLPYEKFKNIDVETIRNFGLYHTLAEKFGIFKITVNEFYHPILSEKYESDLLRILPERPIIKIIRHAISDGLVIEYTEAFAHPVNYQVNISLKRG